MSEPVKCGDDPGGPFWRALSKVSRDVLLGTLGDWVDGPPGYFFAGLQTILFLTICAIAAFSPGEQGARAAAFLAAHGVLYVSFTGGTFAAWLAFKAWRQSR